MGEGASARQGRGGGPQNLGGQGAKPLLVPRPSYARAGQGGNLSSHLPPHSRHMSTLLPPAPLTVNTNGNIVADEEMGEVIQLQGDQRQKVKEWILDQELVTVHEQDRIVIHGF